MQTAYYCDHLIAAEIAGLSPMGNVAAAETLWIRLNGGVVGDISEIIPDMKNI